MAAEEEKRRKFRELMAQNLEESRKHKQWKEQTEKEREQIQNDKIAKFNYFTDHDHRQVEYRNRLNRF